jgi:hypothetical protein
MIRMVPWFVVGDRKVSGRCWGAAPVELCGRGWCAHLLEQYAPGGFYPLVLVGFPGIRFLSSGMYGSR